MSDFDPIGDESARVIVRRLMESVDQSAAQAASAAFNNLYRRVASVSTNAIPPTAITQEYAKRIVECYPFHPRLLDTAQNRLGALQDFQKSRGVLRLFARILRDTWESKTDCEIITAGELDWGSPRIQSDLLNRINRDSFKAAVTADIEQHAKELDGGADTGIHRRVASALLLESLPNEPSSGLDSADLALAVLHLDEAGPEPVEAMDRLAGVCWHTYPLAGGRGWQFRYEPNIIKQVEERKARISIEDARKKVLSEVQEYFNGVTFRSINWPTGPRMVPRSAELQLALCEDELIARKVVDYEDDSDPQAPVPRLYKNALVGITASKQNLERAVDAARSLMAAEEIEREHKTGDAGKLIREQLKLQIPRYQKHFHIQARRAFDKVVLSTATYSLEEKYQVSDEKIIQHAHGQSCIKNFLADKGLIYQPGDSLDPDRFLKNVLPGATPQMGKADVYSVRSVHERFLSAPGLRILTERSVIHQTLQRALRDGKIAVRLSDGRAYDSGGYVVKGGDGRRTRVPIPGGATSIPIDDSAEIARVDTEAAREWLAIDAEQPAGTGTKHPARAGAPPTPTRVSTSSPERILEYSEARPLAQLKLIAALPAPSRRACWYRPAAGSRYDLAFGDSRRDA